MRKPNALTPADVMVAPEVATAPETVRLRP
jgi:hypothetical protein